MARSTQHLRPELEAAAASLGGMAPPHLALLRNLQRLTAPNPGLMTGPGTNSYLVGTADCGHIVIDPGPDHETHVEALWQAAGGHIEAIVCTHSHPDHSPAARPLQALNEKHTGTAPPILGLPSAPTAAAHSQFTPDRALTHGERLLLREPDGTTHTLHVLHTPGHAANHVCLVLEEDGLLFSGDHILNGSTTVIDPPDGNMDAYLRSLDLLLAACELHEVEHILPAHGLVLPGARQAIVHLKRHRLLREAKVLSAMRALPHGTPAEWVPRAYDDVAPHLWPAAQRSLRAHVERIQNLGLLND